MSSIEDTTRHNVREHSALGEEDWAKGIGALTVKGKSRAMIRMDWTEMQIQLGHIPERAIPNIEPHTSADDCNIGIATNTYQ